jgi:GNAT superfamily N-acetyltransferase
MDDIHIREAGEADLADILCAYTAAGIDGGRSFSLEEARQQLARLRQYPCNRLFAAFAGGVFAGTYTLVIFDKLAKRGSPEGVVEDVAVLPAFQRRGVGRAMMEHARAECRLAGCYKMALSSGTGREGAHRFYEALGFACHGYSFLIRP